MTFVLQLARVADPDVFVGNGVGVFGGYIDVAVGEGLGTFPGPRVCCEKMEIKIMKTLAYHSLNSLPWGLSLMPLIMKLAK